MTCPTCSAIFDPWITVQGLTVCPNGHSVVILTGQPARDHDVLNLSAEELSQLRAARKRPRRQV